ncbi:hypothetical protein E2C01_066379 [Portunus trituberculatus]|uniref:Uncharacterized protein n=1 Tax=Portunus trituberculatus TaxID=210409 RepID=A0A5B7HQ41_PORTR|nr:hypothetical protein [Portunus trituberculatus]
MERAGRRRHSTAAGEWERRRI